MVRKIINYAFMCLSKMAAVAFIKDEDHALVPKLLHRLEVAFPADGCIELLKRGHNEGRIISKLPDQCAGTVGCINASFLEAVEFLDGLKIQVLAVNNKNHFLDIWALGQDLSGLEGRECRS